MTMTDERIAEPSIAERIAQAEDDLNRLEAELGRAARAGGGTSETALKAVQQAEQRLQRLRDRKARTEALERAAARADAEKEAAAKEHAATVKSRAKELKEEQAALSASAERAAKAVTDAEAALGAALRAVRAHAAAVGESAGRLEGLGLPLTDAHGNAFAVGAATEHGRSVVSLGGESFAAPDRRALDVLLTYIAGAARQSELGVYNSTRASLRSVLHRDLRARLLGE